MRIREAVGQDAHGIARVHVNSWRTTYRGVIPDEVLDNLSFDRREQYWRQSLADPGEPYFIYVADDPQVGLVGFASAGNERGGKYPFQSELYAIYLLKAYQGQGIGRQLVSAIADRLLDHGYMSMLVWVLKDNPSRRFYEALGGVLVGEQEITIGPVTLVEVAYGWEDIHPLVDA